MIAQILVCFAGHYGVWFQKLKIILKDFLLTLWLSAEKIELLLYYEVMTIFGQIELINFPWLDNVQLQIRSEVVGWKNEQVQNPFEFICACMAWSFSLIGFCLVWCFFVCLRCLLFYLLGEGMVDGGDFSIIIELT